MASRHGPYNGSANSAARIGRPGAGLRLRRRRSGSVSVFARPLAAQRWASYDRLVALSAQLLVQAIMTFSSFGGPLAFYVREGGDNFLVGQHAVVDRHGVGVRLAKHTRDPVFGDRDQIGVTMVPGMAAGVVGRRRQEAIGQTHPPLGLPLQARAMAQRAVRRVECLAMGHRFGVVRSQGPSGCRHT